MSLQQFERKSLQEINQSIDVPKGIPFWKTLLLFSGPGSLVAVGYMDPGNWITSVVGGAQYRYLLLSVVLLSSLIAMQLQQMAGKLGLSIVRTWPKQPPITCQNGFAIPFGL